MAAVAFSNERFRYFVNVDSVHFVFMHVQYSQMV